MLNIKKIVIRNSKKYTLISIFKTKVWEYSSSFDEHQLWNPWVRRKGIEMVRSFDLDLGEDQRGLGN